MTKSTVLPATSSGRQKARRAGGETSKHAPRSWALALAALTFLAGAAPAWAQQPAGRPAEATASLGQVLDDLEPGERVRLHLAGAEPVAADFLEASPESVRVGGEGRAARVATSRIERLDVASHPYRQAALIGGGVGAVALGVLLGASASGNGECPEFECPPDYGEGPGPLLQGVVGGVVGGLGGAGLGALVGAGITTWDQRYPPP